ncbi:unnamed protein product [Symbiodinium pilosum]|uniref:Uncharacterized protein n=1 Tax=Symbiodinium pilosum TaxID=2952 RepID=A0A812U120_SYMPI|nr:unnamed protein product [Symbiodinium pilosum]
MAPFMHIALLSLAGRTVALRQNQEGDEQLSEVAPELLPTGKAGYSMLCCVSAKADFAVADSRFQGAAGRMLKAVAEDGAYGVGADFHPHHFEEHCKVALHLEQCPDVTAPVDDDARSHPDELAAQIEEFLAKYGIHAEEKTPDYKTYMGDSPRCPKDFEPQQDLRRCSKHMMHFLKLLKLWRRKLEAEDEVKDNTGLRGFFLGNPKSRKRLTRSCGMRTSMSESCGSRGTRVTSDLLSFSRP